MFPFCTCKLQVACAVALKYAAINPSDACTLVGIQGRRASAARPSAPVYATFSFCAPPPPRAFLQSLPCRRRSWRTDAIRDGVFGWTFASSAPRAGSVSSTSHALLLRLYSASASQQAGLRFLLRFSMGVVVAMASMMCAVFFFMSSSSHPMVRFSTPTLCSIARDTSGRLIHVMAAPLIADRCVSWSRLRALAILDATAYAAVASFVRDVHDLQQEEVQVCSLRR